MKLKEYISLFESSKYYPGNVIHFNNDDGGEIGFQASGGRGVYISIGDNNSQKFPVKISPHGVSILISVLEYFINDEYIPGEMTTVGIDYIIKGANKHSFLRIDRNKKNIIFYYMSDVPNTERYEMNKEDAKHLHSILYNYLKTEKIEDIIL